MQNVNQKCELCSMVATHSEVDAVKIPHYFCEHHSLKDIKTKTKTKKNSGPILLPLFYVFALIILVSLLRQFTNGLDFMMWMMDLMGIFFITFGLFKLYDIQGFVMGFRTYDIIAKKFSVFGYMYPFIEVLLGVMYLAGWMFFWQNIITVSLALLGIYSAYRAIKSGSEIQCVCLGTAFNLPMTNVTLIENGVMLVMGLYMLVM